MLRVRGDGDKMVRELHDRYLLRARPVLPVLPAHDVQRVLQVALVCLRADECSRARVFRAEPRCFLRWNKYLGVSQFPGINERLRCVYTVG